MKIVDHYTEIFRTNYDFRKEEILAHIEKLKELDKLLPSSSTYLMITNTQTGAYDFISKNFEYATGLGKDQFVKNGIPHYLTHFFHLIDMCFPDRTKPKLLKKIKSGS